MKKRDAAFALSLATLLFLESWDQIQGLPARSFYNREFVTRGDLIRPLVPNILLAAAVVLMAMRALRRANRIWVHRASEAILLLVLYIPLHQVVVWVTPPESLWRIPRILALALIGIAAANTLSKARLPCRVASALAIGACPLLPLLLIYFWTQPHPSRDASRDRPTAVLNSSAFPRRVVLVIFDEWDRYLTFEARPTSVHLQEIDRFRTGAIDVERATSQTIFTVSSLPTLLTGKAVRTVEPKGPDQLVLKFESGETELFGQDENLFRRVRELGGNTALVGWHPPYCRVLAQDLCDCLWEPFSRPRPAFAETSPGFLAIAKEQWRTLFEAVPLMHRLFPDTTDKDQRLWFQIIITRLLSRASLVAPDSRFNLVVLHLPMPHRPGVFNRYTRQFSTGPSSNYLDNLVLVDQTLGQLRLAMERHGTWDSSLILLTADHPFRVAGPLFPYRPGEEEAQATGNKMRPYVPFLIKMPGQREGIKLDEAIKSTLVQDLILSFLRGELRNTPDMIRWIGGQGEQAGVNYKSEPPLTANNVTRTGASPASRPAR